MQEMLLNFAASESPGEILQFPLARWYPHQSSQDFWGWGPDTKVFLEMLR